MADYRALLGGEPTRLNAVDELVERLRIRGPDVPARFFEAARNFEEERNLEISFWHEVSEFLLRKGHAMSLHEVENELSILFRSFQRQGPKVIEPRKRHGRVYKRSDFVDQLMRQRIATTRTKAERVIDKLLGAGARPATTLKSATLGTFLMWSTYCEDCDCLDPFNPRALAVKLIDSLGLCFRSGDQFLVFIYSLPVGIDRFTPTIADAYGSNFFFPFRPGGRTHPIRYQDKLSGRPEVVHEPITGRYLMGPLELLQPDDSI